MVLSINAVHKTYGATTVLDGVSLKIEAGRITTLLGPSGCGKTTLLRVMAGLSTPTCGQVLMDGKDATYWPLARRQVGFVFQNYALFQHMNVAQNVGFGLRVRPRRTRPTKAAIAAKVEELLALVRLDDLAARYPHQLSGGQQQRVALARALAIEPRVLLLDEPFAALDAMVRHELRGELRSLQQRLGISCVLVTHDQDEARAVSDQVVLMNAGRIVQYGTPEQLFGRPDSDFARDFLGYGI